MTAEISVAGGLGAARPAPARVSTSTGAQRAILAGRRADWRKRYARILLITDLAVLAATVYVTQWVRLGLEEHVAISNPFIGVTLSYTVLSTILLVAWIAALTFNDTRSDRVFGVGADEYRRIFDSSVMLFGVVAIIAFGLQIDIARGYLLMALPLGIFLLIAERYLWRHWLRRQRARGEYAAQVLLVGSSRATVRMARELQRVRGAGYHVVAACVPGGRSSAALEKAGIPVAGGIADVEQAMIGVGADTVVITSTDDIDPDRVKEISWSLESGKQHLVLAPAITDIAGPRIHTRPASGLPLMHVETPTFSPAQRFVKRMMDLIGGILAVIVLSPVMLVVAILVKTTSRGPVIFRQKRIGRHGREFEMLKFRSMVVGAEDQLTSLMDQQDMGNGVLFKMRDDPRVTRIGGFLRRHSLDELPQLFNVIGGRMSLVGPRPPLRREVDQYDDHVHRRFLVKPGITGLWQISGRSSLSWDDSVRLDLSYVENWTVMGDVVILFKTVKDVLKPGRGSAA
ncbi:sugar transferase [Microbacterium indicum]|uniref:sugar transferase n=1 Tax=Microbacterium indicum TaxID=358100 RepID=UPI00040F90D2|nr:sugar transferase [Microbacterium indicum]